MFAWESEKMSSYDIPNEPKLNRLTDFFAEKMQITDSAVSHQLHVLKISGLVKKRREGKTIFYTIADEHVRSVIAQGLEHIEEQ